MTKWKGDTWAITDVEHHVFAGTSISAALLSRSKTTDVYKLSGSGLALHLASGKLDTSDFIPIVFLRKAHVFAIPKRPRFPVSKVLAVLKAFATPVLGTMTLYPLLRDQSLRERLRSFRKIEELSFSIVRANPEGRADTKLFTNSLEQSHVQRELLRLVGDPRGINIDGVLVSNQLDYVEEGLGELKSGRGINQAGHAEPISGKKVSPLSLSVQSTGEPADFAEKLARNNPIATETVDELEV